MKEHAISFGLSHALIGVISEPDGQELIQAPIVLILNSGLLHKVGPFRLSVDLARSLSSNGFRVLRFDLSGIGDSKMSLERGSKWDVAIKDVQSAMDYLSQQYNIRNFVTMGLCSGSDHSQRVSIVDDRIIGAVHLDGYGFRNTTYYVNYYGKRLLSKQTISTKLSNLIKQTYQQPPIKPVINYVNREFPSIEKAKQDFKTLVSRGVRLLYIYSWGVENYNNYKDQLRETFNDVDFKDCLELEYYPFAEHTYPTINSRKKVVTRVSDWMNRYFG